MSEEKVRQFTLKLNNETHRRINDFTNINPRKLSQLVVIALLELMETYQLENSTSEDITAFTDFYEYYKVRFKKDEQQTLKNLRMLLSSLPNVNVLSVANATPDTSDVSEPSVVPPKQEETEQSLVSEEERERMKAMLTAGWGS